MLARLCRVGGATARRAARSLGSSTRSLGSSPSRDSLGSSTSRDSLGTPSAATGSLGSPSSSSTSSSLGTPSSSTADSSLDSLSVNDIWLRGVVADVISSTGKELNELNQQSLRLQRDVDAEIEEIRKAALKAKADAQKIAVLKVLSVCVGVEMGLVLGQYMF